MNINLFVYYQLSTSNERPFLNSIQKLGNVTRIGNGFWYVNSFKTASEALKILASWASEKDTIVVIDAASNECVWFNLDKTQAQRIRQNWNMPLAVEPITNEADNSSEEVKLAPNETTH
ncbi:MAG: hypothetical protein HWE27_17680 [Gammaproteobacteria bacterium]|nr:hypothetical protein [Gammaproteobacteria bacterium]